MAKETYGITLYFFYFFLLQGIQTHALPLTPVFLLLELQLGPNPVTFNIYIHRIFLLQVNCILFTCGLDHWGQPRCMPLGGVGGGMHLLDHGKSLAKNELHQIIKFGSLKVPWSFIYAFFLDSTQW